MTRNKSDYRENGYRRHSNIISWNCLFPPEEFVLQLLIYWWYKREITYFGSYTWELIWYSLTFPGVCKIIWDIIPVIFLIFDLPAMTSTLLHSQHWAVRGISHSTVSIFPDNRVTVSTNWPSPTLLSLLSTGTAQHFKQRPSYCRVSNIYFFREKEALNWFLITRIVREQMLGLFCQFKEYILDHMKQWSDRCWKSMRKANWCIIFQIDHLHR